MTEKGSRFVVIHKKRGETPLEALTAWKLRNPMYEKVPATYAGRLDPMAEGALLILLGDECKRQNAYRDLDKEYEVEIVFDIATDTGDVLGMPTHAGADTHINKGMLVRAVRPLVGAHPVPYPPYSSKTVNGRPLFAHALAGTLETIDIPSHEEKIYSIQVIRSTRLSKNALDSLLTSALSIVPKSDEPSKALGADFRQDDVRMAWKKLFATMRGRYMTIATIRVTCASGTYMRTLAQRLAQEFGTTGFALSIKRKRIGWYVKVGPVGVWTKQYV